MGFGVDHCTGEKYGGLLLCCPMCGNAQGDLSQG